MVCSLQILGHCRENSLYGKFIFVGEINLLIVILFSQLREIDLAGLVEDNKIRYRNRSTSLEELLES